MLPKFHRVVAPHLRQTGRFWLILFRNRFEIIECAFKKIDSISLYFVQRIDPSIRLDSDPADRQSNAAINIKQVTKYDFKKDEPIDTLEDMADFKNIDNFLG